MTTPVQIFLTASMLDHLVPSAAELPRSLELGTTVTPHTGERDGREGAGEAGTIGAAPAVMNAIIDALRTVRRARSTCPHHPSGSGMPSAPTGDNR